MADDSDIPPLEDMTEVLTQASAMRTAMLDTVTNNKPTVSISNAKDRAKVKKNVNAKAVNLENINTDQATGDHKTKPTTTTVTTVAPLPEIISSSPSASSKVVETSSGGLFGGMKKGFLFGGTAKGSSKSSINKNLTNPAKPQSSIKKKEEDTKKKEEKDDIPFICPKTNKTQSGLTLDEVQQAMTEAKGLLDNQDWISDDLLNKVEKNELLLERFADPQFMTALQEFQTNPVAAMEKYKGNQEVEKFLMEFCNLLGDHFTKLGDNSDNVARSKPSGSSPTPPKKTTPKISELSDEKPQAKIVEIINKSDTAELDTIQLPRTGNAEKQVPKIVELTDSDKSPEISSESCALKTKNPETKNTVDTQNNQADMQTVSASDDAKVKLMLNDSQVMEILLDPRIMNLIQLLKTDPDMAQRIVSTADTDLKGKIKFLVSKGLLQFQT